MPAILKRRPWLLVAAVAATLCLGACSGFSDRTRGALSAVTPYKVEVVQGNFVSKEQVAALKPGMSRQQVREILGTSLLNDVFHANRWDYVFTIRRQGVEPQERHLTVFFNGELMDRFEGDEMPSEEDFVATLDTRKKIRQGPDARSLGRRPEEIRSQGRKVRQGRPRRPRGPCRCRQPTPRSKPRAERCTRGSGRRPPSQAASVPCSSQCHCKTESA
jgi:outer membrane protein assembly factor BamE